ncbi:hypothetical protein EDD15DRAFT_2361185 [Pisolithus albus]|nr:hypothetical protein EDD15DRAFT_2361185 [Pisolithus albus]
MAFIPSKHDRLAMDLWPAPHCEKIAARAGPHKLQPWERYPCDLEGMCDWATITKDKSAKDKRRENIIVYRTPPESTSNALYPVSVRLYGCLQNFTVGKFGNWDGNPLTAKRAIQSLTLISGGHHDPWRNQLDALDVASAFASRTLQLPLQRAHFPTQLYFQRKADVSSASTTNTYPPPTLSNPQSCSQASPMGSFCTNPNWQWNDALPILQLTGNSQCVPLHEIRLNKFDFVEVDAEFNIVISRGKEGAAVVKVYLSFKHVVRLLDASNTKVTNASQKRAFECMDSLDSTPTVKRLCAVTRGRSPAPLSSNTSKG